MSNVVCYSHSALSMEYLGLFGTGNQQITDEELEVEMEEEMEADSR